MKKREGSPESQSFGPAPGSGTLWVITTKNGQVMQSWGSTAFKACAHCGLNLGQVAHINART